MDKRTIVAFLLIFVIWIVFSQFIWNPNKQQAATQPRTETAQPAVIQQQQAPIATQFQTPPAPLSPDEASLSENRIELSNDLLRLTFSNRGGVITQAVLADYTTADRETPIALLPEDASILGSNLYTSTGLLLLQDRLWRDSVFTTAEGEAVEFSMCLADGRTLRKRYTLGSSYNVRLDITSDPFPGINGYSLLMRSGINDTEEYDKYKSRDWKVRALVNGKVETIVLQQLEKLGTGRAYPMSGDISWAGVRSKYFGIIVVPDISADITHVEFDERNGGPAMYMLAANNRTDLAHTYDVFFGPLRYKLIEELYPSTGADEMAEVGAKMLRPISKFFLFLLSNINKVMGNFGVSIIIFALMLKILLYPLTHKSFESASKMQKIQPQVQEIQRKYRKDPRVLNVELNKLYKEEGVNPMGGCLPLLLQMPFLFALYPILRYSIDLRQEPLFFWLQDLSEPDPYYILPILMGLAMFLQQQFMTPKPSTENMDEKQRAQIQSTRMMGYIMPVLMFVIFMNYPSGLVLYWFVYNLLSIGQQLIIRRKLG
ncbi:MAG: membrane protein insertase YidC [Candidatus Cloacimonetes bacterium]|nr:membrane protein insertase YidC [Candidatus Cloacimonadota bacterium]